MNRRVDGKTQIWYTYILECRDGTLYTGITNNLAVRLETHRRKQGGAYTRAHGAKRFRHSERTSSRSAALKREHEIKQMTRAQKLVLIRTNESTKE